MSSFVYKFVIRNLFVWLPCSLSLLYDSLSPGWKIDVPPSVRCTSVRGFVMLPWTRILSHTCRKLGIFPCMYKYIGQNFIWWETGCFFENYYARFIFPGAQIIMNWVFCTLSIIHQNLMSIILDFFGFTVLFIITSAVLLYVLFFFTWGLYVYNLNQCVPYWDWFLCVHK